MMFPVNEEKAVPAISSAPVTVNVGDNAVQASTLKSKLTMTKYKITAVIVLGLAFIVGAVLLAYMALSVHQSQGPQQQIFQIILRDTSSSTPIRLDVKVDNNQMVEYVQSPEVDKNGNRIGEVKGIRDRKSGIEAYVTKDGDKCFIGKIAPQDKLLSYVNGSIQEKNVNMNVSFYLLNQTIHPYVLETLAGKNIVEFCGNRIGIWMIPIDSNTQSTIIRTKRDYNYLFYRCWWGCYDGYCYRRCRYYY